MLLLVPGGDGRVITGPLGSDELHSDRRDGRPRTQSILPAAVTEEERDREREMEGKVKRISM